MAQSIQVLSDNVVAVDMKYPHLVEAVRNGEIDLDLYRKTMEARTYSLESEDIFSEPIPSNDVDNNHVISKELLDASIVVFITMFVLIILMLILS